MNIQPLNNYINKNSPYYNNNTAQYKSGFLMTEPLSKDTVSFGATQKMLVSRTDGITYNVARTISEKIQPMQGKISTYFNKLFGDMFVTDLRPHNLIWAIEDRYKTPRSIMEKSATRQFNSTSEILEFMTDLNGAKIVMRDSSRKAVEKVLSRLVTSMRNNEIELIEIENKRPAVTQRYKGSKKTQYDYASVDFLEKMKQIQEEIWNNSNLHKKKSVKTDMNDLTDMNYSAIHFLFKFPGEKRPFELTLLDKNVNAYKKLDDLFFKILNNKNVEKRYRSLVDIIKPLTEPGNKPYLDLFNKYRGEAFLFQREKSPAIYTRNKDVTDYFLPLKDSLPPQYDLNNLNRIKTECEKGY